MIHTLFIDFSINSRFFDTYDINDLAFEDLTIDSCIGSFGYGPNLHGAFKQDYTPSLGDKYYFLPGVTVPRVKLKNLTTDYKIKVVRDITQATHVFGSAKSLDKMTTSGWRYRMSTAQFKEFFENAKPHMDTYYSSRIDTALEFYENPIILVSYQFLNTCVLNKRIPFHITQADEHMSLSSKLFTFVDNSVSDELNHMLFNTVYDEKALIKHLNGDDAIEIDAEMFKNLEEMLNSSDRDNHTLAMEIMANSHYEKSLLYLELLFSNHSHRFAENKTKNHVNFKSLTNFLCKRNHFNTDIDDIITNLRKHGQLTKERLDIILKLHGGVIQIGGDSRYFTVKSISLSEEMLQALGHNYSYEVQPDVEIASPEPEEVLTEQLPVEDESNFNSFL